MPIHVRYRGRGAQLHLRRARHSLGRAGLFLRRAGLRFAGTGLDRNKGSLELCRISGFTRHRTNFGAPAFELVRVLCVSRFFRSVTRVLRSLAILDIDGLQHLVIVVLERYRVTTDRSIKHGTVGGGTGHSGHFGSPTSKSIAVLIRRRFRRFSTIILGHCSIHHILVCFKSGIAVLPNDRILVQHLGVNRHVGSIGVCSHDLWIPGSKSIGILGVRGKCRRCSVIRWNRPFQNALVGF